MSSGRALHPAAFSLMAMRITFNGPPLRLLTLFIFLLGCSSLPPADPDRSQHLHEEAAQQTFLKNYPTAIELYREAILYAPGKSILYRQQAEILETVLNFDAARETYELALKRLPQSHLDRETILYRYGLLLAREPDQHHRAQEIAQRLSDPARKLDLQGVVALHDDRPIRALELFSDALQLTDDTNQQSRIYYHAARAYYQRGDSGAGGKALFHAVNGASSLALKKQIKLLFEQRP